MILLNSKLNALILVPHRSFVSAYSSCRSFSASCAFRNKHTSGTGSKHGNFEASRLRNIGIIAHINAGKTTTTERMLFHAGSTDTVGDVDRGNTVTDYLVQERDRGITITSAAVSFDWKKHRINLIDTPGHVDFTIEVERSLSVLDGAITILDASAGVEAQTVSVWNQASKYHLPNIIFLNKCDKPQADIDMCMRDLMQHFEIQTNLIQLPVKLPNQRVANLSSIIDIIDRSVLTWTQADKDNGTKFTSEPLEAVDNLDKKFADKVEEERERLVNSLSDFDEELTNHVISCDKIADVSSVMIIRALRNATLDCKLSPVLVGSSFRHIGVQHLMDAILAYLPNANERRSQILTRISNLELDQSLDSECCALVFKIMHDKRLGALSYVRVYSGNVFRQQKMQNLATGKLEQIKKVYRAFADELREIETPVCRDDIVVLSGLTESKTGDILVSQGLDTTQESSLEYDLELTGNEYDTHNTKDCPFKLLAKSVIVPKITYLEPVYFCSIESRSASEQLKLEQALACMAREDPSLSYEIDSTGCTTIRGMGKLHLEVTRDRIQSEYGVNPVLGPLQISYRETIDGTAKEDLSVNRTVNGVNNSISISLLVNANPGSGVWRNKRLRLDYYNDNSLGKLRQDHRKAIEIGLKSAMTHGPLMGYAVIDCDIVLSRFSANGRAGLPLISSTASQCLTNALSRCSPVLLEPIMMLEVIAPQMHNGVLISDLTTTRRGIIMSTQARSNGTIVIKSKAPLSTLADYSEFLRITTSGRASFSMELHTYSAMSEAQKLRVTRL